MSFNYKFYLDTYSDLRHLNKEQAYQHWINHGIKEGRICKPQSINTTTNITIIIHLFFEPLLDEFIGYINDVNSVFQKVNVILLFLTLVS